MISGSLAGLCVAFAMYLLPLTGVTATPGPLLTAFGCAALVLAGAMLHDASPVWRRIFTLLRPRMAIHQIHQTAPKANRMLATQIASPQWELRALPCRLPAASLPR